MPALKRQGIKPGISKTSAASSGASSTTVAANGENHKLVSPLEAKKYKQAAEEILTAGDVKI